MTPWFFRPLKSDLAPNTIFTLGRLQPLYFGHYKENKKNLEWHLSRFLNKLDEPVVTMAGYTLLSKKYSQLKTFITYTPTKIQF